jgi:hypothetical protein
MTATKTPEQVAEAIGREHGANAASWYFDGDTGESTYRAVLLGIEEGDPEVLDTFPSSPLSGEWADSYSLADLASDTETPQDSDAFDDVCRSYEDGFYAAAHDSIEATARRMLS